MLPEQRVKLRNLMESARTCFIQAFGIFIIILTVLILYGANAFRNVTILFSTAIFLQNLFEGIARALSRIYT